MTNNISIWQRIEFFSLDIKRKQKTRTTATTTTSFRTREARDIRAREYEHDSRSKRVQRYVGTTTYVCISRYFSLQFTDRTLKLPRLITFIFVNNIKGGSDSSSLHHVSNVSRQLQGWVIKRTMEHIRNHTFALFCKSSNFPSVWCYYRKN